MNKGDKEQFKIAGVEVLEAPDDLRIRDLKKIIEAAKDAVHDMKGVEPFKPILGKGSIGFYKLGFRKTYLYNIYWDTVNKRYTIEIRKAGKEKTSQKGE